MPTNTETKRIAVKENTMLGGFLEAVLFGETDESNEFGGDPLDENYSISDFSDESLVKAKALCDRFNDCLSDDYEDDLDFEHKDGSEVNSPQGGRDLYFTAAGHGVGFWDGDWSNGDKLTDLVKNICKHMDICVGDDGQIHIDITMM